MEAQLALESGRIALNVQGTGVEIAYLHRAGPRPALVCLHGFGSTKEDYADLALHPDFADRALLFLDAPGYGTSDVSDPARLSIPFLVDAARAACDHFNVQTFHLAGHSMGGLTALLLAHQMPQRVLSFASIEGNVAPEDCFLSRQIIDHPAEDDAQFLAEFAERVVARQEFGIRLYVRWLSINVTPAAVRPVFQSMVEISDEAPLLDMIGGLPMPRAFIHGAQNSGLSYLPTLPGLGVEVVSIPGSAHFPMYSNAPALWEAMAALIAQAEAAT